MPPGYQYATSIQQFVVLYQGTLYNLPTAFSGVDLCCGYNAVRAQFKQCLWATAYITQVLCALWATKTAVAQQAATVSSSSSNGSINVLLAHLWPVLWRAETPGRVYYRATCSSDEAFDAFRNWQPLTFPQIDVQEPSSNVSVLRAVQSIFRNDPAVSVTEDKTGIVRVRIGEVPDALLQTRIAELSLNAFSQYNLLNAIDAIENAPEVRIARDALKLSVPAWYVHMPLIPAVEGYPHLPSELSNVTMDQALDQVAQTWGGIVFYGICPAQGQFEVFRINNNSL
jgi:hypothetical protein